MVTSVLLSDMGGRTTPLPLRAEDWPRCPGCGATWSRALDPCPQCWPSLGAARRASLPVELL